MFRRILVALDGTPAAERVLPALRLLAGRGATLHLLHVLRPLPMPSSNPPRRVVELLDRAEAYLAGIRAPWPGARVRRLVRPGDPERVILEAAEETRADLIAMGHRDRKGLTRFLHASSVSKPVLRGSSVPVFLTRTKAARRLRIVLVPLDGTKDSLRVLKKVRPLLSETRSELVLMRVVPEILPAVHAGGGLAMAPMPPLYAEPGPWLDRVGRRLRGRGWRVTWEDARGDAVTEILRQARRRRADLIAMGTHGRRGLARLLQGSVAEGVARRADRPLLIFPVGAKK
ncbi:MAG: universal stress protein [Planctomycetes bacterium]|nr:universal stress protein [Planctomycetota bacterium]